jgi:putative serine protease PepD
VSFGCAPMMTSLYKMTGYFASIGRTTPIRADVSSPGIKKGSTRVKSEEGRGDQYEGISGDMPSPLARPPLGSGPRRPATTPLGYSPPPAALQPPAVPSQVSPSPLPAPGLFAASPATFFGEGPPPRPPIKPRGNALAMMVGMVCVGLLAGGVGGAVGYRAAEFNAEDSASAGLPLALVVEEEPPVPSKEGVAGRTGNMAKVAAAVLPSVAHVSVVASDGSGQGGSGSGFFISEDGILLTNNHVVETSGGGGDITVQTMDGKVYRATVIGTSPEYDLAVVQVKDIQAKPIGLGDSKSVQVGEMVIAVGSPLGLQGTVTSGIISALDRAVIAGDGGGDASYLSAIQTDAAINPGNSGGPLVDMLGRVIGMNTAIATVSESGAGGSIGLGFAVPVHVIKRVSREILETGSAQTPIIGVEVDLLYTGSGARIRTVTRGGQAEQSGLVPGDVVTKVGDVVVADASTFIVSIRALNPGDTVVLRVDRNGETIEVPVLLGPVTPAT